MDTLSSSVSSLNLPSLPPPPKSLSGRRFPTTSAAASQNLPKSSYIVSHRPTSSSSSPFAHKDRSFHQRISFSCLKPTRPPRTHEKAASGYAAALVGVCQSKNCLVKAQGDVARLMEFLVGERKSEVVKEVVMERGKFGRYLKGLVNMLVEKDRLGILGEVLVEFERICDELVVATQVVWVSP